MDAFTTFGHDEGQVAPVPQLVNQVAQPMPQVQVRNVPVRHNDVDIKFPMTGEVYKFEKILIVKDAQWLSYDFSRFSS